MINLLQKSIYNYKSKSLIGIFVTLLLMININNVELISLCKKYLIDKKIGLDLKAYTVEKIPGFLYSPNDINKNICEEDSLFFKKDQKLKGIPKSIEDMLLLDLLFTFSRKEFILMFTKLRNLFYKTTKYRNSVLDFKKTWSLNQKNKKARRAFDVLQSIQGLHKTENAVINSNFTEEEQYSFLYKYNRPIKLFFSFFQANIISPLK